jgi:hypothetical protein
MTCGFSAALLVMQTRNKIRKGLTANQTVNLRSIDAPFAR